MSCRGRPPARAALRAALALVACAAGGVLSSGDARAADPREVQLRLPGDEPAEGSPQAPITMVEFTDYECPYCRRFQAEVWPLLKRDYIATGRVRFVALDLPLEFHPDAHRAAGAAHCAGEQGAFWPMHAALLAHGSDLSAGGLEQQARALGLDLGRFRACMATDRYSAVIERNAAQAAALGLRGTPAFVIGSLDLEHGVLHGEVLMGALPYPEFAAALHEALRRAPRAPPPATTGAAGRSHPPPAGVADAAARAAERSPRS